MQIDEQILNLWIAQLPPKRGHLAAAEANDLAYALVIGGQSTLRQVLFLENALQAGPSLSTGGIGLVALITISVVHFAPRRLLLVETKFSIRLAPLDVA